MELPFVKMHGAGNDYVFVDAFEHAVEDPSALAVRISDRRRGIGGDGLILIAPSEGAADARMVMFNADGSRGRMCGNGLRCVAKFLFDRGRAPASMQLQTDSGIIPAEIVSREDGRAREVRLILPPPELQRSRIPMAGREGRVVHEPLVVRGKELRVTALSTGNPHCVVFVEDLETAGVEEWGPAIQECGRFPEGVNVEFAQRLGPGRLRQRTYERGSGQTDACGSGAVATAIAAALNGDGARSFAIELRGGVLEVEWAGEGQAPRLTGPAVEVFAGVLRV